jgi:pimeloyl-ACP methyl ester carboxylesterase
MTLSPNGRRGFLRCSAVTLAGFVNAAQAAAEASPSAVPVVPRSGQHLATRHRTVRVGGLDLFYREAGPADAPAVLLLHGFPSSSFMFRDLIPHLAARYRVIAPDYPGFGQSSFPNRSQFRYSFENIARVLVELRQQLRIERHALYIQDYGAPVGLRLALLQPERITALVVQNGNAYEEGFNEESWAALRAYWRAPTPANRKRLRGWLTAEGIRQQYLGGVPEALHSRFSPDTWTLDWALLRRPGNIDVQLDLFADYATNVSLYPRFQQFLREHRPPTLIAWGRHDPFFTAAGAEAYRRDLPHAELEWLDTGHFALETHAAEIGSLMSSFLSKIKG